MTDTESQDWGERVQEHGRDIENMSSSELHDLLKTLAWKDSSWLAAVHFALVHGRNLVWLYGLQVTEARQKIKNPEALRSLDIALMWDEYRIEKLDGATEASFADMRRRAWSGVRQKAAEKQQKDAGNEN